MDLTRFQIWMQHKCSRCLHYLDRVNKLHGNPIPYSFALQTVALGKNSVIVSVQEQNQRNACYERRAHAHGVGCQRRCLVQLGIRKEPVPGKGSFASSKHVFAGSADAVACENVAQRLDEKFTGSQLKMRVRDGGTMWWWGVVEKARR